MAECRDCGRQLDGDDGYFEVCGDHDLECLVPERVDVTMTDIAVSAVYWTARRAVPGFVGEVPHA